MMFINVMNEDIFDVTFSIYLDNQIIRQWRMQAPRPFIEIKFIQTVQQIASQSQPMKVIVSREEVIWDQFEETQSSSCNNGVSKLLRGEIISNEIFYRL